MRIAVALVVALVGFPACERLAVEHADPAFIGGGEQHGASQKREDPNSSLHLDNVIFFSR
jgi:hypothetical protein